MPGWGREVLEGVEGGGGLGPKSLCNKNGPTRFFNGKVRSFPLWSLWPGGGGVQGGVPPLLLWCKAFLILPWLAGRCYVARDSASAGLPLFFCAVVGGLGGGGSCGEGGRGVVRLLCFVSFFCVTWVVGLFVGVCCGCGCVSVSGGVGEGCRLGCWVGCLEESVFLSFCWILAD